MKRKTLSLSVAAILLGAFHLHAAPAGLHSAKVTQVHNDVRLQQEAPASPVSGPDPSPYRDPTKAPTRAAQIGDVVKGGKLLSTGKSSRAELLFNDNTVARLGANSVFTFRPDSRNLHLSSGFILMHTPKGHGGASITTPSATAAVLGTTVMLSAQPDGSIKLIVLEGTATLTFQGKTEILQAGQLATYIPGQGISAPTTIDLKKLVETSIMITSFPNPLGSEKEIQEAIELQQKLLASGELSIGGDESGLKFVTDSGVDAAIQAQRPAQQTLPPSPPSGGGGQGGGER